MKLFPVFAVALVSILMIFVPSVRAAPTPEQSERADECGYMASAELAFAAARDQGLSQQDAFKSVTRGQSVYEAGSPLDQAERWAYDHPTYQPETATAYFYGRCVLVALDSLTPELDAQLKANAEACQHDHGSKPDELRSCINDKTAGMITSLSENNRAAAATATQPIPTDPAQQKADADFDSQFRCPESYADPQQAQIALKGFMDWTLVHHSQWTVSQLLDYQYQLLVKHSCTKTLDYMKSQK